MEHAESERPFGTVQEIVQILEKCDKTVLKRAKVYDKELDVTTFRKALCEDIIHQFNDLQKNVKVGQGEAVISSVSIANLINLVNCLKSMMDLLTPANQRAINTASFPLSKMTPGKELDEQVAKMMSHVKARFDAVIQSPHLELPPSTLSDPISQTKEDRDKILRNNLKPITTMDSASLSPAGRATIIDFWQMPNS